MKFDKGDLVLDWGFESGNRYIWEIIDGNGNWYTSKIVYRFIVSENKSIKIGHIAHQFFKNKCKKITRQEAFLESL